MIQNCQKSREKFVLLWIPLDLFSTKAVVNDNFGLQKHNKYLPMFLCNLETVD